MKSLASTRYARATMRGGDTLGNGMDAAFTLVAFLGIGFLIDRWLGTTPIFMIVLFLLTAVGLFVAWKARYTATMEQHEADRLARTSGGRAATTTTTATTTAADTAGRR